MNYHICGIFICIYQKNVVPLTVTKNQYIMKKIIIFLAISLLTLASCKVDLPENHRTNREYIGTEWAHDVNGDVWKHIIIDSESTFKFFYTDFWGNPITHAYQGLLNMDAKFGMFPVFEFLYEPLHEEGIGDFVAISYSWAFADEERLSVETTFVDRRGEWHNIHQELFYLFKGNEYISVWKE